MICYSLFSFSLYSFDLTLFLDQCHFSNDSLSKNAMDVLELAYVIISGKTFNLDFTNVQRSTLALALPRNQEKWIGLC